jgi:hypothetical protein
MRKLVEYLATTLEEKCIITIRQPHSFHPIDLVLDTESAKRLYHELGLALRSPMIEMELDNVIIL